MVARQFRVLEAWSSNLHTSTKKEKDSPCGCPFLFCLRVRFESIRTSCEGDRILRSEIGKPVCQAESESIFAPRIPPHKTALAVVCSFFVYVFNSNPFVRKHEGVLPLGILFLLIALSLLDLSFFSSPGKIPQAVCACSARRSASLFARRRARVSSPREYLHH